MNSFLSKSVSFVILLFATISLHAAAPNQCPITLNVHASGIQSSVLQTVDLNYQLQLFASEIPNLTSVACMSFPGSCLNCFYYDNQVPQDKTRIHHLSYQPAVSFAVDGVIIHNPEVIAMATSLTNNNTTIQLGINLKSFSANSVEIKSGQAPYVLEQRELVDVNCTPLVVADAEQPCETVVKAVGLIRAIQIK